MSLKAEDFFQVGLSVTVIQESIVAYLLEAVRQYMHEETSDEFSIIHSGNMLGTCFVIHGGEGNLFGSD